MQEVVMDIVKAGNPIAIIVGLLILHALRDLGAKLKKVDHIDALIYEVKILVEKIDDIVESKAGSEVKIDDRFKELEKSLNLVKDRVLVIETHLKIENGNKE